MDSIKLLETRRVQSQKPLGAVMWPFLDCRANGYANVEHDQAGIDCCNSQYSHALSLLSKMRACKGPCSGDVQICPRLFGRNEGACAQARGDVGSAQLT
jgi:hypothetical protein